MQIREVFEGSSVTLITLAEAGIEGDAVEDGNSLEENALKKALYAWDRVNPKEWTMADDTGLFIHTLNGEPGVRSARWAGETATTDEITQYTLKRLKHARDRTATFVTVVSVVDLNGKHYFFRGAAGGTILEVPRTRPQPNMPYSPIFVPRGDTKVLAEMSVEQENSISHRGRAFRRARHFLEDTCSK